MAKLTMRNWFGCGYFLSKFN